MRESSDKERPGILGLLAMTDADRQINGQTEPITMQTDAPGLPVLVCELQGGSFSLDLSSRSSRSPRGSRRALLALNACWSPSM